MRHTRRILVTAAAGVVIGSLAIAAPAVANGPAESASVSGATVDSYAPAPAVVAAESGSDAQAQKSSGPWKPGVEKVEDGWLAYIEAGAGFVREEVGVYKTRKEARKAAKEAAEKANGVMDGPGCGEPGVLC